MSRRGSDLDVVEGPRAACSLPLACHDRVGLARTGSFRTFRDFWSGRTWRHQWSHRSFWSSEGVFPDNVPLIVFAVVSTAVPFKSASHGSPPPVRVTA